MKPICHKLAIRVSAFCIAFVICLVSVFPVHASKVSDLQNQSSNLQSNLSDLNKELKSLEKELDDILSKVKKKSAELEKTKKELAIAKGKEQAQHNAMMLRIKYMYENGNMNMLEVLLSSSGIVDFIANAEMISLMTQYDRALLKDFVEVREEVAAKEKQLEEDSKYLKGLQSDLNAKEKNLKSKISDTNTDLSNVLKQLADAKKETQNAQNSASGTVEPILPSGGSYTGAYNGSTITYNEADVHLLAALIECEAGSRHYEGMLAVGAVVVNRMKHPKYPNTLYAVIYSPRQFTPAGNGKVKKVLERGVKESCVTAARDALNGKNNVGNCLQFRAASSGRQGLVIGDNVFF